MGLPSVVMVHTYPENATKEPSVLSYPDLASKRHTDRQLVVIHAADVGRAAGS